MIETRVVSCDVYEVKDVCVVVVCGCVIVCVECLGRVLRTWSNRVSNQVSTMPDVHVRNSSALSSLLSFAPAPIEFELA